MKRILSVVIAFLVIASPALASSRYAWMISASSDVPYANTGGIAAGGLAHLYLWYYCSYDGGMAAADFGLRATGVTFAGFSTMNGFLNAGSGTNLLLAVGGCPLGPVVAGDISVFYFGGAGSVCIVDSINDIRVVVDCTAPTPSAWNLAAVGWDAVALPGCEDPWPWCWTDAIEPHHWGAIKGLYR
ncbi:MAG: hypothetical protein U0167_00500 [bacterium]